jgi:hypothetical protein
MTCIVLLLPLKDGEYAYTSEVIVDWVYKKKKKKQEVLRELKLDWNCQMSEKSTSIIASYPSKYHKYRHTIGISTPLSFAR